MVGSIPAGDDVLDPDEPTYDLSRVAELLGIPVTKVHQQLRVGHLVAVRRAGRVVVPQAFFTNSRRGGQESDGLIDDPARQRLSRNRDPALAVYPDPSLTVTRDGSRDALSNARPVDALHAHQAREIVRRAQAMAY